VHENELGALGHLLQTRGDRGLPCRSARSEGDRRCEPERLDGGGAVLREAFRMAYHDDAVHQR
jgi:hypothetical protein